MTTTKTAIPGPEVVEGELVVQADHLTKAQANGLDKRIALSVTG